MGQGHLDQSASLWGVVMSYSTVVIVQREDRI